MGYLLTKLTWSFVDIKFSKSFKILEICLHQKKLGRRFNQTCMCACLLLQLFCLFSRSGLPDPLVKPVNFCLNSIQSLKNTIIYYQKIYSRKFYSASFKVETAGIQCACNALPAVCWTRVRKVSCWNTIDLDWHRFKFCEIFKNTLFT